MGTCFSRDNQTRADANKCATVPDGTVVLPCRPRGTLVGALVITRLDNLPAHLPTLIGCDDARVAVCASRGRRIGSACADWAGGIGKTRLALAVASDLSDHFVDGVWLVDLAPLTDPAVVADSVAAGLSVREQAGRSARDMLLSALRNLQILLSLDNCEHLL